jgi:hypothetical protein
MIQNVQSSSSQSSVKNKKPSPGEGRQYQHDISLRPAKCSFPQKNNRPRQLAHPLGRLPLLAWRWSQHPAGAEPHAAGQNKPYT